MGWTRVRVGKVPFGRSGEEGMLWLFCSGGLGGGFQGGYDNVFALELELYLLSVGRDGFGEFGV